MFVLLWMEEIHSNDNEKFEGFPPSEHTQLYEMQCETRMNIEAS